MSTQKMQLKPSTGIHTLPTYIVVPEGCAKRQENNLLGWHDAFQA